ncbi:MAG: hypothetical protein A2498_03600 [Lentisphaerae bacterium RIFOXYC12_FULL_60_16]|nr:MAG: hypothetical protein A2498_03600 [Lentisphaerae bacterium RIFOXYC12_FULL_60_16]
MTVRERLTERVAVMGEDAIESTIGRVANSDPSQSRQKGGEDAETHDVGLCVGGGCDPCGL